MGSRNREMLMVVMLILVIATIMFFVSYLNVALP